MKQIQFIQKSLLLVSALLTLSIEMCIRDSCLGFKIKEVPITFVNRKLGSSKMNGSIFGEAFTGVLKLRYWRLFKGFPKRRNPAK